MIDSQQVFLRDAMRRLDLTRDGLAQRIAVRRRALDAWLLPSESSEFRSMPDVARQFIAEILARAGDGLPAASTQSVHSEPARFFSTSHPTLLSVDQFSRESIDALFHVADVLQPVAKREKVCRVLEGAVLGNLFFEASTRTRISFGAAFCRLGGAVCDTTGFTFSSMAKGESIRDTSRVISGYVDVLVVRHPDQGAVAEFASASNLPIINGGDGPGEHPTQALLDLYTLQREFARHGKLIDGAHIVLAGDLRFGRTVHSLIKLLALYKSLEFTLVSPSALAMPQAIVESVRARGHRVQQVHGFSQLRPGADVLYTTRLQKERFTDDVALENLQEFQVDLALVNRLFHKHTIVMHPLPRDSRANAHDLSTDLDGDARLAIFRQTDNGIPVRMAVFAMMLGVDHLLERSLRSAQWHVPRHVGVDEFIDA